jgi:hypothetical protein
VRHALWIDIREPGGKQRQLLFEAEAPNSKHLRQRKIQELVGRLWPSAQLIRYSGGVGKFEVGRSLAVAHFAAVRDDAPLLPVTPEALATEAPLRNDDEAHPTRGAPLARSRELQLRLL